MWIYWVPILGVGVAFFIVYLDSRRVGEPFLQTGREWQSLIGAAVGFSTAVFTLLVDSDIKSRADKFNKAKQELALLNRLTADSMATRKSLTALRDTMPAVDKFDGPTCANSLRIQKTHPLRGLNQLVRNDQFPGGVSAELYLVMVDAQQALNLYYAALKDLEPSDCTDANRARQFLVGITTDAIDQLGAVLGRSKELAAGLESSIGVR